jgi:soluble lytic murein transglycosylase-like protein
MAQVRENLPLLQNLKPEIERVAREKGLDPALLAAIVSRESGAGSLLDARGFGDHGNGCGLMQIDKRAHGKWLAKKNWRDPATNLAMGAQILVDLRQEISHLSRKHGWNLSPEQQTKMVVSAYNCGAGNASKAFRVHGDSDRFTAGRNYATDVLARAQFLRSNGFA